MHPMVVPSTQPNSLYRRGNQLPMKRGGIVDQCLQRCRIVVVSLTVFDLLRHAGLLFVSLRGKFHDPAEKLCRSWAEKGDWKWHKYSSTWCLVRDRHHLFNGSISIYGYLQRNQTIENASLPAALMGKIKGHPNFFFFPRKIAILISLRGKGHAWLAASCANFLRCLYCFWLPPLASDSEDAACSSSNSAVWCFPSPCSIFSRVVTKYKIFCRRHACVHFEWSTRN